MKDYFDRHALAHEGAVDTTIHSDAIAATFGRRVTEVPAKVPAGLLDSFAIEPTAIAQWNVFLARNRLEAPSLVQVVAAIRDLVVAPLHLARAKSGNSM